MKAKLDNGVLVITPENSNEHKTLLERFDYGLKFRVEDFEAVQHGVQADVCQRCGAKFLVDIDISEFCGNCGAVTANRSALLREIKCLENKKL